MRIVHQLFEYPLIHVFVHGCESQHSLPKHQRIISNLVITSSIHNKTSIYIIYIKTGFGVIALVLWKILNTHHGVKCISNDRVYVLMDVTSVKQVTYDMVKEVFRFDEKCNFKRLKKKRKQNDNVIALTTEFILFLGSILSARTFSGILSLHPLFSRWHCIGNDINR